MIPFARFAPDQSQFNPDASDRIINVLPQAASYGPFPSFVTLSGALPGQPRGAFLAQDSEGEFFTFAATLSKLYMLDTDTLAWTDVSKTATSYTTNGDEFWAFTQFGNSVIATNFNDTPQAFEIPAGSLFDNLAGSPPMGMHAGVIGDFLFFGQTSDGTRAVRWSGLNDHTYWQVGNRSSDVQPFADGGRVQGIVGYEKGGVIFQEKAIRVMTLALDTPLIFTARQTASEHGCIAPKSIVNAGAGGIFYLAKDGFYRFGEPSVPIGSEVVNRWFIANADPAFLYEVQGIVDPIRKIIYWRWRSTAHTNDATTDKVLAYHFELDRWTLIEQELSWLISAVSPGYNLDNLDSLGYTLDTLPFSLDSRSLQAGQPLFAAFNADYELGTFSGANLEAVIQTPDIEMNPGARSVVTGFRPVGDMPTISGRVGGLDTHGGTRSWGNSADVNATGLIPARKSARLHRFEVTIPAGTSWNHIHGIAADGRPEGKR